MEEFQASPVPLSARRPVEQIPTSRAAGMPNAGWIGALPCRVSCGGRGNLKARGRRAGESARRGGTSHVSSCWVRLCCCPKTGPVFRSFSVLGRGLLPLLVGKIRRSICVRQRVVGVGAKAREALLGDRTRPGARRLCRCSTSGRRIHSTAPAAKFPAAVSITPPSTALRVRARAAAAWR